MPKPNAREGFALAVSVFALVVLGILATGGFYLARQETRIGVATERAGTAFYLAERGVFSVLSEWDADRYARLAQWSTARVADTVKEGIWSVDVTRMSSRLYFLLGRSEVTAGEAGYGSSGHSIGIVAKIYGAHIDPKAALTTVGELTIGGASGITGSDLTPAEWSGYCDPPRPDKPGILIDSLSNISTEGKRHTVEGNPPTAEDNSLTPDSLLKFGDLDWDELVSRAELRLPNATTITQMYIDSVLVDGSYVCKTSGLLNWGDPYHPDGACGSYFPVIYAEGDLTVEAHDYGQGILLVEGDLTFKGGFEFFGPVIVKESVLTEGTGGHFNGGLIAANVHLDLSTVLGDALIRYSSCAVQRAVLNSSLSQIRPLERRSYADITSVVGG